MRLLGGAITDVDHGLMTVTAVVTEEELKPFAEMLKQNTTLQSLRIYGGKRNCDENRLTLTTHAANDLGITRLKWFPIEQSEMD